MTESDEPLYPGYLIIFEGTDGTGKSTQLELLAEALRAQHHQVVATREPTTGPFGMKIRELYVNRERFTPEEELELFIADRKEHVADCILPALQKGQIVLCDRYYLSTAAYQGAIGFDPEEIIIRNSFAPAPDLAFIFSAPPEISMHRITQSRGDQPNDFEKLDSLRKVAAIFAGMDKPYIRRVDATLAISEIHEQVMDEVASLIGSTLDNEQE